MTRILLTGASGFLGGHIVVRKPVDVSLVALYRTNRTDNDENVTWIPCDIRDVTELECIITDVKPQAILHTAASSKPDECDSQRDTAYEINTMATGELARLACKYQAKLVYLSTDMVYDGEAAPYTEMSSPKPLQWYGETKLQGERLVMAASPQNLIIRSSVMFGSRALFGDSFSTGLLERLRLQIPSPVFTDQIRSTVSVKWIADRLYEVARSPVAGKLQLGGVEGVSRAEFAYQLANHFGYSTECLRPCSYKSISAAPRPRDLTFDLTKAKQILSQPPLSLPEALTFEWNQNSTRC
ncbi:MAG: SDR family oxidoreductase [bacterium]|nr:SDR family oxidoreductase [bacterium]